MEYVEPSYTFIENQLVVIIQVRKEGIANAPFQVRVFGGKLEQNCIIHVS